MLQSSPFLATGDDKGLSVELPFQSRTSLLTVTTGESNPQLGNGVLLRLSLPMNINQTEGIRFATELTRRELQYDTRYGRGVETVRFRDVTLAARQAPFSKRKRLAE